MKNAIALSVVLLLFAGAYFAESGSSGRGGMDDTVSSGSSSSGEMEFENESQPSSNDSDDDNSMDSGRSRMMRQNEENETRNEMAREKLEIRIKAMNMGEIRQYALENNVSLMRAAMMSINESELQCDGDSLRERVECRVRMNRSEDDDNLKYFPEECRNTTNDSRTECLARQRIMQSCRLEAGDDRKITCAREALNITKSARSLVEDCKLQVRGANWTDSSTGGNAGNWTNATNATANRGNWTNPGIGKCVSEVRSKVYEEAKFRLQNLEEKAQRLQRMGVGNSTIVDFVAQMEELKVKFDAADGADAKKAVLQEAQDAWKAFVAQARQEIADAKNAAMANGG